MGLLESIFGGGGGSADDPYADILTPAQRNQMQVNGLLAMAGAFADAGMPSRLPIPFGSALGKAAQALGAGQESGMKTAIENALAAQKVRDLRNLSQYRTQFFGDQDKLYKLLQEAGGLGTGTMPAPGATPAGGATPSVGTGARAGAPPASAAGAPLTMDASMLYPGLLGGDVGAAAGASAEGEYGGGQKLGGLLGPGPTPEFPPMPDQPGLRRTQYGFEPPKQKPDIEQGTSGGSSGAPAEPAPGLGGDEPWGPTFPQQAAARVRGGPTPEMTDLIVKAAADNKLPPQIMHGLLGVESNFDPGAVSPTGAKGIAQFISSTARSMKLADPFDPQQAIPKSAEYLAQLRDQYGGDLNKALMAYNAGGDQTKWNPGYAAAVNQRASQFVPPDGSGGGSDDAGWGPTFSYAQGGQDRMLSSAPGAGGDRPQATLAQYAAPGAGGAPAPAAPPAGGVLAAPSGGGLLAPQGADPAKYNALLLELARRNAAAEVLGMGNPYGSLLGVLQGTPQYKGQITGAEEAAREPYRQTARDQELKNALIKEGWQLDAKGNAVPVPLYNDVAAAKANAISTATEGPKLDSALAQQNKMRVYDAQGHVMIVPIPGGAEAEARAKGLQTAAEEAVKTQTDIGKYTVLGPDGRTNYTVEMPRAEALQRMPGLGAAPKPGQIVGTLALPPLTPGQTKAQEAAATDAQTLAQSYRTTADLAVSAKTTLQNISGEIGSMVNGPFAPAAQTAASYLRILDPSFNKQVQSYEELYANANELVRKAVRQSDPNPSFIQTQMAFNSMPVPEKSPAGLQQITNRMIGINDHDIARAAAIDQYKATTGGVDGFDSYWRKNVSPYAFVFSKMVPDDQRALVTKLNSTEQGKREIAKLKDQLGFIKQNGLEQ